MIMYVVIGIVVAVCLGLCLCLAIASFSFDNYYEKFREVDLVNNSADMTTLEFVKQVNNKYFKGRLKLTECEEFEDHYSAREVSLSAQTMESNSLASLAIVAHELGHARQDFSGKQLRKHWGLKRKGRLLGLFFMPLVISGVVISLLQVFGVLEAEWLLYLGLGIIGLSFLIFSFAIFLKCKEIKIEKEASMFALDFLAELLTLQEIDLCKEFLNSARLTYWGSLFRTMFGWTLLTRKERMFK